MAYLFPYVGSETKRRPPPVKAAPKKPMAVFVETPPPPPPKPKPPIDFMNVQPHPMPASVWKIMREVCQAYNVYPHELVSDSRDKKYYEARKFFVVRMRTETSLSFPQIGRLINKDHSTAVYYYQKWRYDQKIDQTAKPPRGWARRILKPLSERELEYLRLEEKGVAAETIALMWGIAPSTIRTIRSAAHRKAKRDQITIKEETNE